MTALYEKNCKLLNVTGYQKRLFSIKLAAWKIKKNAKLI